MKIDEIEEEAANRGYWTGREVQDDASETICIRDQMHDKDGNLVFIGDWEIYNSSTHKKATWMKDCMEV